MDWLRRFMMGRYGGDQLSMALIILSVLLSLIAQLIRIPLLGLIGYIPIFIAIYRILSRDISRRSMENYKFAMFMSPVYSWFRKTWYHIVDSRTHRYFKCPNCKAKLRVPKGKGKIIITCPKCKTEFKETT